MTLYIAWSGYANGDSCTLNTGATSFNMSIPSGFLPWDNTGSTVWDTSNHGWNINFSNNNLTISRVFNTSWTGSSVRTTTTQSSGKYYFEFFVNTFPNVEPFEQIFGLVNGFENLNNYIGANINGLGYRSDGQGFQIPNWQGANIQGLYIGIAIDLGTNLIWARTSANTNWNNNVLADPTTGVGGFAVNILNQAAIQSYFNPVVSGISQPCGALQAKSNWIYSTGPADSQQYLTSYNFTTGSINNYADINTMFNCSPTFQSNFIIDPNTGYPWSYSNNSYGLSQFIPGTPWTLGLTWGNHAGIPNGVPESLTAAWATVGIANYTVINCFIGGQVNVYRMDSGNLGFWGHSFNTVGASSSGCIGPQNSQQATIYWTSHPFSIFGSGFHLASTIITDKAANGWNPSDWPTPNPYITSQIIQSYVTADFDNSWSSFNLFSGPSYDQIDGNVIILVSGYGGGHPAYIVKLSTDNGAIMWKVPLVAGNGFDEQSVCKSVIQNGQYLYFDWGGVFNPGTLYVVNTSTGLYTTYSYFAANAGVISLGGQSSNDVLGCIIGYADWNSTNNYLTFLNSTETSGSSLAAVYFASSFLDANPYQRCTGSL